MRELTLKVETPQIKINGEVFDVQMSDLEVYARAQELFERYKGLTAKTPTPKKVLEACREMVGLIDEILGAGATQRISCGHPVSLKLACEWLALIAKDAAEHYEELATEDE